MSRNFDILQRAGDAGRMPFGAAKSGAPVPPPAVARTSKPDRNVYKLIDDEIIKLVQRVFILPDSSDAPGAVTFAGVDQGDGCSWVCARASEMLADQVSGTVCVVDANLRTPSLHEHFRFENGVGFAEAVKSTKPIHEFARRASGSHLWLITAGGGGNAPNGALNPARLRARIGELRNEFDYVLLDTPPIHLYGDAVLLGQLTDGMIVVVGSNSTRRESARMAKESVEAAKIPILGAVLNRRQFPIPEAIYRKL
jgi:Mrp family chromosome partitioning ATPase